ncbi:DNA mismatch repair protein MutS [Thermus thermophilus]|uniref:DNA mismatch repair protein MutS n=1 Tax=Thermus thermophilus (strain ATCC BAA-163 / DSM 7039 / HB27) TaxID=262724 RepID=MUTS_THET2|nr:DNA mismatch repair protein MutS [Thermus thermophilus]P61671.1 RecName: Full=DNA mismatch repair protein MutS [Thermus thermophilus HB27]AAS81302.1 DNA mismatch repair protein mutS [Thermus thermophilus HB27]QMV31019.1 DNA mismatch repair protein MutS [Thermus thermophilus]WMV96334.1 DNA mismatch repair protein MutS [Thermus thermophilus HB27]
MGNMLKGEGPGPLPPLLQQYVELRDRYPDYLLLFQVGDFYECFGEDAERLARALGLVLTHKTSKDFTTPMAGIPIRAFDAYAERLLKMGFRLAVADQVEPAEEAEGLVRREVTQLLTPGTLTQEALLPREANYLAAIATGDGWGLAFLDVSTGEFKGTLLKSKSALYDELFRHRPAEVLLAPELRENEAFVAEFRKRFPVMLSEAPFEPQGEGPLALRRAQGALLAYARATQGGALSVRPFRLYDPGAFVRLPEASLKALEVFEPLRGQDTLFGVLDETRTAPGRRLLQAWLRHPLLERGPLEARLDRVERFVREGALREGVRRLLFRLADLERLATRLELSRASPRDLAALRRSLEILPELKGLLGEEVGLPDLSGLLEELRAALVEDPPLKVSEGGLIREGYDPDLDALRRAHAEGVAYFLDLEAREKERTGIPTLKVGYNAVFGYYLEVTRPYYEKVPQEYRPVQTLKDRQRYTLPEMKERERELYRLEALIKRREEEVFLALRERARKEAEALREAARILAELDVYAALAEVAVRHGYTRPRFGERLRIRAGRHPVVERRTAFVPNDLEMAHELVLVTGPNMAGKSTFLRQTALIALLAQIGSFVPAEEAELPLFDGIYTRIGASDDLAGGKSTFMVEMEEVALVLKEATERSLVLLDEVGRGTSSLDGVAIATALAEALHERRCYTLFATHYFELTALALPRLKNLHVAAKEEEGGLVFYHQVLPGPASKSYGVEVAEMAGLPKEVVERARALLSAMAARREGALEEVLERLLALDPDRLTPLEALRFLHELKALALGLPLGSMKG